MIIHCHLAAEDFAAKVSTAISFLLFLFPESLPPFCRIRFHLLPSCHQLLFVCKIGRKASAEWFSNLISLS